MSQPIIVLGDKTSHGGSVISCAPTSDTHGQGMARMTDKVSCPRCKGVYPIMQGDPTFVVDGQPVAYHGCKVSCGATLISSQVASTTEPSGGTSSGTPSGQAAPALAKGFGTIGAGLMAGYQDEPLDDTGQRFRGRFQVLDLNSGEPVAEQQTRLRSTGGQNLIGATDAQGFTQWMERNANEALAFDLLDQGQA